jgi:hypothetical protein
MFQNFKVGDKKQTRLSRKLLDRRFVQGIDKPNSVPGKPGGNHFSSPAVTRRLQRPTREIQDEQSLHPKVRLACLALLPMGVAWPDTLPHPPVGSYPTFSP